MAFVVQSILSDALAKQRIGNLNISLDSWTDTAIPNITAGSWATIAGSVYYATGDTTIDGDGTLAAGANSTLYYYYIDSVDLDVITTTTVPTWQDDKAEWASTLGGHYCRCIGEIYKNSSGVYEEKYVYLNFNLKMSYNGISSINYNEPYIYNDSGGISVFSIAGNLNKTIIVKKPISGFLELSGLVSASSPRASISMVYNDPNVTPFLFEYNPGTTVTGTGRVPFVINPGKYYIDGNTASATLTMYVLGIYGIENSVASTITNYITIL